MPRVALNPDDAAALTRLVLGYCLGRGSVGLASRSYALQLHQPARHETYIRYQWSRLRQFLPGMKPPVFITKDPDRQSGQWRVRTSSRHFETAHRLLYPDGLKITSELLELLGGEAMAALWADRGWVNRSGEHYIQGRLNLSRFGFADAELLQQWIQRLTGADCRLDHGPRSDRHPMLVFSGQSTRELLQALNRTWMAQAPCLSYKFEVPPLPPHTRAPRVVGNALPSLRARGEQALPLVATGGAVLQQRAPRRVPDQFSGAKTPEELIGARPVPNLGRDLVAGMLARPPLLSQRSV